MPPLTPGQSHCSGRPNCAVWYEGAISGKAFHASALSPTPELAAYTDFMHAHCMWDRVHVNSPRTSSLNQQNEPRLSIIKHMQSYLALNPSLSCSVQAHACIHKLQQTHPSASEPLNTADPLPSISQHPFSSAWDEVIFSQPDYHCRHKAISFYPTSTPPPPSLSLHPVVSLLPPSRFGELAPRTRFHAF